MTIEQEPDDFEIIDINDAADDLEPIDEDDYEPDYDLGRKEDDLEASEGVLPLVTSS